MSKKFGLLPELIFGKEVWSAAAVTEMKAGEWISEVKYTGPQHQSPGPGRRRILFIDEAYTGEIMDIGMFVDRDWFESKVGGNLSFDEFCAGSDILTTTAGILFGLLPASQE